MRTERAAQTGTRQERTTGQRDRYAQKDRLRQQDVPAEREDRYVRREMTDHSVQAVTERTVRFVTAVMQEADVRMETEEVSVRKEEPRDNRDARGGREQGFGDRDNRDGRNGQGSRPDRKNDNRRNDRADRDAAPIVEQQKSQRNKAKDKERDNKKKEYRDEGI